MLLVAAGPERLDVFLARSLPEHSRSKLVRVIEAGLVAVDGQVQRRPSLQLREGAQVEVGEIPETPAHSLAPMDIPLDVRYEDDDLLVVNKPRGLASHPALTQAQPTLVNALLARSHSLSTEGGDFRPGIVHRLDKDTSGLMVVAKNDAAHRKLADQIRDKVAERRYFAIILGRPEQDRFTIDAPIGRHPGLPTLMAVKRSGRPAITFVRVVGAWEQGCLIAARLATGRTHQIRVHLATFGHPIKGDRLYAKDAWREGPLQLHAAYLAFDHPSTGARVAVYAEPPEDFEAREIAKREMVEHWT